jgi:hypothetical protein
MEHCVRMIAQCKQCGIAPTIEAHIIPKAVVRNIRTRGPDLKTIAVFNNRAVTARNQNGVFDRDILCKDCDGKIGTSDKWFVENLEKFHSSASGQPPYSTTQVMPKGSDALRFAVSVIYRASLSKLAHFHDISLGQYEAVAARISLGLEAHSSVEPIVLVNVLSSETLDMRQFVTYPIRCVNGNGRYYVFTASGVQFLVKFGGRRAGVGRDDIFTSNLRARSDSPLVVCCYPFNDSAEAHMFAQAANRRIRISHFPEL